jgi:hypothetical protein
MATTKVELTHIIGTRIPYTVRLTVLGQDLDLSTLAKLEFRGTSDASRSAQTDLTGLITPGTTSVQVLLSDLVNELRDKFVNGRFFVTFPDQSIKASRRLLITIRS